MTYIIFLTAAYMAVRCIGFGIFTIRRKNIAGGVASIILALLSVVAAWAVFY